MALITEQDRIEEFQNIKDVLDKLDIAAEILKPREGQPQSCLMVSLPTDIEDWEKEYETDMHMAVCNLIQLDTEEAQQTKYLMIYSAVMVDMSGVDELGIYRFLNEANRNLKVGTCFFGEDLNDGRKLVQLKWMIGGYVDEYLDAGVVGEAILELGNTYDTLKEQLLKQVESL